MSKQQQPDSISRDVIDGIPVIVQRYPSPKRRGSRITVSVTGANRQPGAWLAHRKVSRPTIRHRDRG